MFTAMAIMMIAGVLISAYGQYESARQQEKWAEYNAALSKHEAEIETQRMEREKLKLLSRQRAAYSKAGVQLTGTPLEVMEETAKEVERDILLTRYSGAIGSKAYQARGAMARQRGMWEAGSTLLTGGARAGEIYMRGQ